MFCERLSAHTHRLLRFRTPSPPAPCCAPSHCRADARSCVAARSTHNPPTPTSLPPSPTQLDGPLYDDPSLDPASFMPFGACEASGEDDEPPQRKLVARKSFETAQSAAQGKCPFEGKGVYFMQPFPNGRNDDFTPKSRNKVRTGRERAARERERSACASHPLPRRCRSRPAVRSLTLLPPLSHHFIHAGRLGAVPLVLLRPRFSLGAVCAAPSFRQLLLSRCLRFPGHSVRLHHYHHHDCALR